MSETKRELEKQFNRAKKLGWLPFFEEAARTITNGFFDTADLLGIASRESNLDPKWLEKAGDGGNGFGLMQADRRSFPNFTRGDGWKDARTGILFGAKVLMQKWADYESNIGKTLTVKSSRGGSYKYKSEKAEGAEAQHLVLSSYNCGRWSQYAFANHQDIDKYSTGKDYGADVMKRAAVFRALLAKNSISTNKTPDAAASEELRQTDSSQQSVEDAGQSQENPAANLNQNDSTKGTVAETVSEKVQEDGKEIEKTSTEVKSTFDPKDIPAFIPRFGKQWFLSLIPGSGLLATIAAKFAAMPDWLVFTLGFFTGITTVLFAQLIIKHREKVIDFVTKCYETMANPEMHNLIPTNAAAELGTNAFGFLQRSRRAAITQAFAAQDRTKTTVDFGS